MRVDADALRAACRAGLGAEPPRSAAVTIDGARALLEWLVARVARRRMAADDVRAGYCARSAREVLAQACVPFTAPCADLSGVAALLLAEQGFDVTLVLGGIKRALRHVKFQCGIELDLLGGDGEARTWVVGFGVGRSVLYEGRFLPTPRRPWVFRRRPEALDLDRAFLSYFEPEGREGLARLVPGYDLERDIESHVRRSGRLSFGLARLRAGGKAEAALRAEPEWAA